MNRYEWRGAPVTEEEFLSLADSKMVLAEEVLVAAGKSTVINCKSMPLYFIEAQLFGPGVTGTAKYTYWREVKS